jgi:hypothetical protein
MDRFRKYGLLRRRPSMRTLGLLALMGFALFVSFRIFTPPSKTVQILAAPDGSRAARLQHVYYYSTPGIKIAVREEGRLWHTLFYLPEYTNAPTGELKDSLRWSGDSATLYLEINGQPVWSCDFADQSSRLKSP